MNPQEQFADAREKQWTWKTPAMAAMAVAVCRLALERGTAGEFSANDLHLESHGGTGICGSIFTTLAGHDVIAPVGSWCGSEFIQRYVRNPGGNRIGVWRLKSAALAARQIELHSHETQPHPVQAEFPV